eukprot:Gregarina_sp_Pseudo_9__134@NODE_1092_length_1883_cov_47_814534_g1021_i0_p1_GENE_NODE_1092_length_1883_cov_47_814534_g1021_i0NODE_1092_length_1883_cov_47_814534_g1021_i0_p1_ORF_typecomplete_len476_score37_47Galactosyl_T/PF01762_21/3_9e29Fringe/PF02434_16/0_68_NODE_1092_length_1883_cov_47_814534_g1021_i01261553
MRLSGNGIIFAAIATAGVILLAVAARVSSLASEIESVHQEQDQPAQGNLLPRAHLRQAEGFITRSPSDDDGPKIPSQSDANSGIPQAEPAPLNFLSSVVASLPSDLREDLTSPAATSTASTTTVATTTESSTSTPPTTSPSATEFVSVLHLPTFPAIIKNESWPFAEIVYNPISPCAKRPKAISAVLTLPKERKVRDWLREEIRNVTDGRVIPVFPLGRPHQKGINDDEEDRLQLEEALMQEAIEFQDLILGDFADSYEDLPRKTIMVFDWFNNTCHDQVRWLLKEDADVVINWQSVLDGIDLIEREGAKLDLLPNGTFVQEPVILHADKDPIWMGHRWLHMPVIHHPRHRNFEELPFDYYPPYCSGPSYLMNDLSARMIMEQRKLNIRYFRNEDAMLGLLLVNKTVPVNDERFIVFTGSGWRREACGKETESISECACDWWTYHCGGEKPEYEAALRSAYQCAHKEFLPDMLRK